jgi:hypothetical protein
MTAFEATNMTLFFDQLKAMILNDQTPELFRMMKHIYQEQEELHAKTLLDLYKGMSQEDRMADYSIEPETESEKIRRLMFWWDVRKFECERLAESFQCEINERALTRKQLYEKQRTEQIERAEAELRSLKSRS